VARDPVSTAIAFHLLEYDLGIDTTEIIEAIDAEIKRFQEAKPLLDGTTVKRRENGRKRVVSPAGGARIAAAQRARWTKAKRAAK
jgi:hypothetical protein